MNAAQAPLPPLPREDRPLATLAVSLASFMHGVDLAVTNVSVPAIAGDLGGSLTQGTWIITSYAVSSAIVIPLTGWLTARIGQVRLFISSVLLFTLASILCGLSTSLEMLVVARCLQGVTSGPMTPLAMTLLLAAYPPNKAMLAMTISMMTAMISPIVGPLLGGWITDNLSWPWIFYINIPVGILSASLTWRIFRDRESARIRRPVDYVGLILLIVWVGTFQGMLDLGRDHGWLDSPTVRVMAIVATIAFLAFLVWEWHDPHPVVDLHLFRIPNFSIGVTVIGIGSIPYFGSAVLMALWLQQSVGYTATLAGSVVMFSGVAMLFFQPLVGKLVPPLGIRAVACLGVALLLASAWLRSGFSLDVGRGDLILPQLLFGLGTAAFFMPLSLLALGGLPQAQVASATGISSFIRVATSGMGTSLATTVWDERTAHHRARLAEKVSLGDTPAMDAIRVIDSAAGDGTGLAVVEYLAGGQAQTLAANDFSAFCMLLYVICLASILLAPRTRAARA